jgi:integrase
LQEFINGKYLNGYSKNHLTNISSVLSGSLKYAVHPCNFMKDNPMQYVKNPKYEHSKAETNLKIITNDEFNMIINRFPPGSNFYIPIMIGYYGGLRIGEVMGLTWDDIDLDNGTIDINKIIYKRGREWHFGSTKTKTSVRNIKIGTTLNNALKKHNVWQSENRLKYGGHYIQQYTVNEVEESEKLRMIVSLSDNIHNLTNTVNMVCTKENGCMITPESFKYASRVIHYSLGIVFSFHSLRHTHATMLIENGANVKYVQVRLGHTNIETTLGTYTHVTKKMAEQTVDIFESATNKKLIIK